MALDNLVEIETMRQRGEIVLRGVDTNVAMDNEFFMYILTGNLSLLQDFEQNLQDISINGTELNILDKKPNDLLIPWHVHYELDGIKKSQDSNRRFKARRALNAIDHFLTLYQKQVKGHDDFLDGKAYVPLPNGANVYFTDYKQKDLIKDHGSVTHIDSDTLIVLSMRKFLKEHSNYQKFRFITSDSGARSTAKLMGIPADNFRFNQVGNPNQQNQGYSKIVLPVYTFKKLTAKKRQSIPLQEDELDINISPENLRTNHVVSFTTQKSRENILTILNSKTNSLDKLIHYPEFLNYWKKHQQIKGKLNWSHDEGYMDKMLLINIIKSLVESDILHTEQGQEYQRIVNEIKVSKQNRYSQKIQTKLMKIYRTLKNHDLTNSRNVFVRNIVGIPFNQSITPKGTQPAYIDLLSNPDISIVSIDASAGYGKTMFAFAAGLYMVGQGHYDKIHYFSSQPTAEIAIGTLPGDKREKIGGKVNQVYDAFHALFGNAFKSKQFLDNLIEKNMLELDVISEIHGRTFTRTYVISDEFHFYDKELASLIIERPAHDSKLVILSAIDQLDTSIDHKIRKSTAGISHMAEEFIDVENYAHFCPPRNEDYRGPHGNLARRLRAKSRYLK